jgi:hypothetical protein
MYHVMHAVKLKSLRRTVSKKGQPETFEVILQLHTATGLQSELNGSYVFWAWKRGSHAGTTLKTLVGAGNKAVWDDSSVNVQCSMFPKKAGHYESKELTLALKEVSDRKRVCVCGCCGCFSPFSLQNDSSRKVKKKYLGKATIELAQYAASCGGSEFSTHFLKFDLLDDAKTVSAKVTATLKIRRDPTGSLYGTSRLSSTSHSSVGRYESDSADSFQESDDDDAAAGGGGGGGDDDEDERVTLSPSAPKTPAPAPAGEIDEDARRSGVNNSSSSSSSKKKSADVVPERPTEAAPEKFVDKDIAAFRPPASLMRTQSIDLRSSVSPELDDAAVSPRTAAMSLVATTKLVRRASLDGRRSRPPVDVSDEEREPSAAASATGSDAADVPSLSTSGAMAIPRDPAAASPIGSPSTASSPPHSDALQPPSSGSGSRRRSDLTRMESLRADNLRKYGQRRRNDGEPETQVSPRSAVASPPNTPPVLVKTAVSDGNLLTPGSNAALLREKDAELERLKSQLDQQQREDNRRFFVEETIVFMEPAYADDGLPVAAYVIFRTMLQWDAFDGKNARFIGSVVDAFDKVLKRNTQNREVLLYALATCVAVGHLLRSDPASAAVQSADSTLRANAGTAESSVGNASDVDPDGSVCSSPVNRRGGGQPLGSFLEQLSDVSHALFARCIELLLSQCDTLLVPAILEGDMNNPERNAAPKQRLMQVLKDWHNALVHVHQLPAEGTQQLFFAVFDELNARLFNALLERRDLCSCGNGLQTKMNVMAFEQWASSVQLDVK